MDETLKPVRIPPHMSIYADKHNLSHLVQSLVSSLVVDRPDDPISYLVDLLQRSRVDIPRVMLLGPPAVGKHTLAKRLSAELKAVHVTMEGLLEDQSELRALTEQVTQDVPADLLVQLVQQRLKEVDCLQEGWVLEGIPQTRLQVLLLQQVGIIPDHVVMLEAPEEVLLQRAQGRLLDSLTGAQRLERGRGLSEEQLLAELQRYRCEVTGLRSAYQHVLGVINADQPHTDVYHQALALVQTRHYSRTPRILLLGPPGSGKSLQARLLSENYKMVNVCCGQLLRSAAADGSGPGALVQPYLDDGRPVPDSVVLRVLEERLSRVDCSCRGWVLHGFPLNLQQARSLQETQNQPNRVFLLEAPDHVCLERLSLRTVDPLSGERYHTVTRPAPSAEVQARLQTAPEDRLEEVTQRLNQYRVHCAALQSVYPDVIHINANQNHLSVFEALESRLTTN
ncbi:adenylate kinase 8 isoform X3 [Austrofundulus limnaeus]|uniref:Adenylate kinase 8 isoform X3 n=1 Tax=Austrofundulus limnaeus TaxID=52670 RepID=A0A2I4CE36_AUSLI|nr:PREDICTED: adenylate kinase 8 isoform X3 [Austrofundulus limnaeus]